MVVVRYCSGGGDDDDDEDDGDDDNDDDDNDDDDDDNNNDNNGDDNDDNVTDHFLGDAELTHVDLLGHPPTLPLRHQNPLLLLQLQEERDETGG